MRSWPGQPEAMRRHRWSAPFVQGRRRRRRRRWAGAPLHSGCSNGGCPGSRGFHLVIKVHPCIHARWHGRGTGAAFSWRGDGESGRWRRRRPEHFIIRSWGPGRPGLRVQARTLNCSKTPIACKSAPASSAAPVGVHESVTAGSAATPAQRATRPSHGNPNLRRKSVDHAAHVNGC